MSGRSTGWILSHFWHAAINQNVVDSWLQNRSQGYKNLYMYLWFYLISFCRRLIVKQWKNLYKNAMVCAMWTKVTIAKMTSNVGKIIFTKSSFMCRHCTNLKWHSIAKIPPIFVAMNVYHFRILHWQFRKNDFVNYVFRTFDVNFLVIAFVSLCSFKQYFLEFLIQGCIFLNLGHD